MTRRRTTHEAERAVVRRGPGGGHAGMPPGHAGMPGLDHFLPPAGTPVNDAMRAPSAIAVAREFLAPWASPAPGHRGFITRAAAARRGEGE
jgi:hypothetical protein